MNKCWWDWWGDEMGDSEETAATPVSGGPRPKQPRAASASTTMRRRRRLGPITATLLGPGWLGWLSNLDSSDDTDAGGSAESDPDYTPAGGAASASSSSHH